jgi:hypothetical protein
VNLGGEIPFDGFNGTYGRGGGENPTLVKFKNTEKRGSFEGAIGISCDALSFLFNNLAFLIVSRKY